MSSSTTTPAAPTARVDEEWEEIDTDGFSILSLSTDVADDDDDQDDIARGGSSSSQPTQAHDAQFSTDGSVNGGDDSPVLGHASTRGSFEPGVTLVPPVVSHPPEMVEAGPSISKGVTEDKIDIKGKSPEVPRGGPPPYSVNDEKGLAEARREEDRDKPAENHPADSQPAQTKPAVDYTDIEVNSNDIYGFTTSTAKIVDGVIDLATQLDPQVYGRMQDLKPHCDRLKSQLGILTLITRAYARHWTQQQQHQKHGSDRGPAQPAQADVPVPLDANLYDWLIRLHTAADSTKKHLQHVLDIGCIRREDDTETGHWAAILEDLAAQMGDFLSIIETDFAEFQTAHLTFQSLRDLESTPIRQDDERSRPRDGPSSRADGPWESSRPMPRPSSSFQSEHILLPTRRSDIAPDTRPQQPHADTNIDRLRRELYSLKDQLVQTTEELEQVRKRRSSLLTRPPSSSEISPEDRATTNSAHKLLDGLLDEFGNLKIVLERLLSNNPSDWLDDSIALAKEEEEEGGHAKGKERSVSHLTYAEFVSTDTEAVCTWRMQLKKATTDMFLGRCRVDSVTWNPDSGGCSRTAANEESREAVIRKLQAMRTIGDILVPMFVRFNSSDGGGGGY